jgi:23S rRNA (cytosine1962-C5)-methyltransferase
LEILDDGGTLLAVNNLSSVTWDQFAEMLTRSCAKSGRILKGLTRIQPESDFPSPDGQPPLKIAELTL